LGYPPGGTKPADATNHRNGTGTKTVLTDDGPVTIEVPRDRTGTFEPQLIRRHERRFTGFDDTIVALYARGMTVREIRGFLAGRYAVDVSPDLISTVTDGSRDILGLWIEQTEGAKFWMKVFADLKTRGCEDILIAVTDGLKGMSDALAAVYPATTLQTCIVHLIRYRLAFGNWKERKAMAAALRPVYAAPSAEAAAAALDAFERGPWGVKFPTVVASWRRAWAHIIPFFAFPPEVRRLIYTTNALESVHARLRKIIKTRGHFPNDEAARKLIWLALRNITATWERVAYNWPRSEGALH
jgi:transposase-like protein